MASEEIFPLDPEKVYFSMDELTLDTEDGIGISRLDYSVCGILDD